MATRMILVVLILALAGILTTGCSSKHKLVPGAPDWINQGSGAFKEEAGQVFFGVGAVTGITSQPLAVQASDQRARADIARQLDTFVNGLYRDYLASTSASTGKMAVEEQHVDDSLKNVTQVSVHGARIIDHWKDPDTNTFYSLARLDLEGVKATLENMQDMDPSLRNFIRSNAEKSFDKMRLEERGR